MILFSEPMYPADKVPFNADEINAINRRCYDAKADYWDRLPFPDFLPSWIQNYHDPVSGWQALDIGSGTGRLALWLRDRGFHVICLDPSPEMVRRTKALGLETIQTTIQDYSTNAKFGLITAILSLIHLPKVDMPRQLQKISSMLVPGGTFALALIAGQGEGLSEKQSGYPRYFGYYTSVEIKDLLQNDFECLAERRVEGPVVYLVFLLRKKN